VNAPGAVGGARGPSTITCVTLAQAVRLVCVALGALLVVAAVTIVVVPLPAPAAGGTCGPGASSETAVQAFFDPVSIGAGPLPSASSGNRPQWHAFVDDCQSATNTRITVAGVILVVALFALIANTWIVRRVVGATPADAQHSPLAWYPDPADPGALRWWDGQRWGPGAGHAGDIGPPVPGASSPAASAAGWGDPRAPS